MKRATIRKRDGAWVLTWQPYGFGIARTKIRYETFAEAVAVAHRRSPSTHVLPGTGMLSASEMTAAPLGEILMRRTL